MTRDLHPAVPFVGAYFDATEERWVLRQFTDQAQLDSFGKQVVERGLAPAAYKLELRSTLQVERRVVEVRK